MHYRFELQLILSEIVANATVENEGQFVKQVVRQHVKHYLERYHADHGDLPTGRRYPGMTRPLYLEIGMVDFDRIRDKIQADFESTSTPQTA